MMEQSGTERHIDPIGRMYEQITSAQTDDQFIDIYDKYPHGNGIQGIHRMMGKYLVHYYLRHEIGRASCRERV